MSPSWCGCDAVATKTRGLRDAAAGLARGAAPPARTGPPRLGLRDTMTVDRHLVHRDSPEHVFVNDVGEADQCFVGVGWLPRHHRYFNDFALPRYDLLLLTEVTRQVIEVMSHVLFGVPTTSHFVLRRVDIALGADAATNCAIGPSAGRVTVVLPRRQVRRGRDDVAYAVEGPVQCFVDDRLAAVLHGTVGFLADDAYNALRAPATAGTPRGEALPCPPRDVGRSLTDNVYVTTVRDAGGTASCIVVPRAHPAWFDRPLDHYPGLQLAEAGRQLTVAVAAARLGADPARATVKRMALEFTSFAELDEPVVMTVTGWDQRPDCASARIVATQEGAGRCVLFYTLDTSQAGGTR